MLLFSLLPVPCPLQMVSWMCNLEATGDLIGRLEALADRHVDYGCRPLHCESITPARGSRHIVCEKRG